LEKYHLTARIVNAERGLKTIADVFLRGDQVSGNSKENNSVHHDLYEAQGLKMRDERCLEGL